MSKYRRPTANEIIKQIAAQFDPSTERHLVVIYLKSNTVAKCEDVEVPCLTFDIIKLAVHQHRELEVANRLDDRKVLYSLKRMNGTPKADCKLKIQSLDEWLEQHK